MIFSLKTKLNRSWKSQRNWNVPLVVLEISWWTGFNGIYFISSGLRMWEILKFEWFLSQNSNKFQKTRFWKVKSVENMLTHFESLPFNSSMISFHICNGFTLGRTAQATPVTFMLVPNTKHQVWPHHLRHVRP
jgi:hypothetical protein